MFLFAFLSQIMISNAFADSFIIGAGPTYSQITLPSDLGNSIYQGPGYIVDARLRFFFPYKTLKSSFDFFVTIGQKFARNTGAAETHTQDHIVGGLDLSISNFFLGAQYGRSSSIIKLATGNFINFSHDIVGLRLGLKLISKLNWGVSLTGTLENGVAVPDSNNNLGTFQKVNQYGAALTFYYKLMGDRF